MVVSAIEKFAQLIPLNVQEIFTWYFEQKGVDNPERFLAQTTSATLAGEGSVGLDPWGNDEFPQNSSMPENSQSMSDNNPSPQPSPTKGEGVNLLQQPNRNALLLGMLAKILEKAGNKKIDLSEIISNLKNKKSKRKEKE